MSSMPSLLRPRTVPRTSLTLEALVPLALALVIGGTACSVGLGRPAPLVLTEVPNDPEGVALIRRGAQQDGCRPRRLPDGSLLLDCPDGRLHLPTFAGPPTLAVRCIKGLLADPGHCQRRVRRLLFAGASEDDAEAR
jgi:hypothetical protein